MQFKRPKNTEKYYWTRHSIGKMMQYGLSAQRIVRVIRAPERVVEGVAKNTIAVMQPSSVRRDKSGKRMWSQEIWAMYQINKKKKNIVENISDESGLAEKIIPNGKQLKIISVWRYPGVSPKGKDLPEEILAEIKEAGI